MCGIAGIASARALPPDRARAQAMADALARRGPDGAGVATWDHAHLAHRRLAIFDLSERGAQPMLAPDGSVAVVFNGAIYNFLDLRAELGRLGFHFRSDTDTEVLVHGYSAWGLDALVARLRGMYAFAIWDEPARKLSLVRDRLGVKPLVYAVSNGTIAFGSTVAAVRAAGMGGELDPQAVTDYLEWGVVPEQRSIFTGIRKLPPGSIAEWQDGALAVRAYWAPPQPAAGRPIPFAAAVEETERLLLQAVRRRTFADVPIGALLSGGIDSALVCWALRESGSDLAAYTFAAPGEAEDESQAAEATARELGIELHVVEAPAGGDELGELVAAYSEPFACGSALGMLRLARAARSAVTVLLTGDGGDDVFLGYPHHRFLHDAQRLAAFLPVAAGSAEELSAGQALPAVLRRGRNFIGYVRGGLGALLRARPNWLFLHDAGVLGPRLRDVVPVTRRLRGPPNAGRTVLPDYLEFARTNQFAAEYLAKVDGATMYFGLEARSPFLDHELWEYAAALPYDVRLHRRRLKAVLREIARRRISERVAAGGKQGFEVPIAAWLSGRWRTAVEAALDSARLASDGWVDGPQLLRLWRAGEAPALAVWYVFILELWLRQQGSTIQ